MRLSTQNVFTNNENIYIDYLHNSFIAKYKSNKDENTNMKLHETKMKYCIIKIIYVRSSIIILNYL